MTSTVLSTVCVFTYIFFIRTLQGKYYQCPHPTDQETGTEKFSYSPSWHANATNEVRAPSSP